MKNTFTLSFILILILALASGCSSDKQSKDELACIVVSKNYPEKEIVLTDIAKMLLYLE